MKKIVILTSVFALAACSGGGHHSGGHGGAPAVTVDRVADTVGNSNAQLTGMVSNSKTQVVTYVANKLGDDAELVGLTNNARTAKTRDAFVPSATTGDMNYARPKS